jgi:hypothetical protein
LDALIGLIPALLAATLIGQESVTVAFRTLAAGTDSKIAGRHELVARTAGTWHLLWHKHSGRDDAPPVDVRREMVVAVFAGKTAGGGSIQITRVAREGGTFVVHYRQRVAAAAPAATAPTTPFHIIAIQADGAPVRFVIDR